MKTTILVLLLSLSVSAFANEKPDDKPKSPDIFTEVREILR